MKKLKLSNPIIKYLLLTGIAVIIFFVFRVTYLEGDENLFNLSVDSWFYLIYTVVLVLLFFQVNEWVLRFYKNRYGKKLFSTGNIIKYQISLFLATATTLLIGMYFMHFHMPEWLGCNWDYDPLNRLINDYFKGIFVGIIFNVGYVSVAFINYKRGADLVEEKMKKENLMIKYESLRNQIDPHFLFNSFSVLNSLIKPNPDLATKFLNNLSDMYRYVLDNRDNNIIAIKEELKCLDSYITLMQIRHEGCIKAFINISDDVLEQNIPTMSLQMLVENAIKHNSFNEITPLNIQIFSHENYIEVRNNKNIRKNMKTSAGIGLENIKNRYNYYSEKKVEIFNNENEFIVRLPVLN
jgi:two-component system LytT family sensor kinase